MVVGTPKLKRYQGTSSRQRGCTWGNVTQAVPGARCTKDLIVRGSFPPGVRFAGCLDLNVVGTPQQPGTWKATIRLPPFKCPEGITRSQDIEVTFRIKGYAPRKLR